MQFEFAESVQIVNRKLFGPDTKTGSRRRDLALTSLFSLAFLCLVVYCGSGAVMMTIGSAKLIPNQVENTYPESVNIYAAIGAARTGRLYSSPSQPPYILQPFGPLYYLINATIARASHLDFDSVRTRTRLLSYGCFLLSAVIIFLISKRLRFSTIASILAALMLLGQPYFLAWNATVRPDMLFLMVMLSGLLWAVEGDALGGAGYVVAGILGGLAFLIKQPGIAGPLAIFAVLAYRRKYRCAAVYALGAMLPVALMFVMLLWRREPFFEQFFLVGKGLWSLADGARFAFDKLWDFKMVVPIFIGAIGISQAIRGDTASWLIAAFAIANWAVGLSGLPQLGSNVNYFLPGLACCALLLPFAVQMVRQLLRWKAVAAATAALIIVVLLRTTFQVEDEVGWLMSAHWSEAEKPYAALAPFKILSDRTIFTVHGRDPDLLDPYSARELELAGHWDSSPVITNVIRGDYDLIILAGSGHWPVIGDFRGIAYFSPALVKAINDNYRVLCSTMTSAVLSPRARDVEVAPTALGVALGQACGSGMRGHSPNLTIPPGDL